MSHRRDPGDELGFADGLHLVRPVLAIHRVALQEHAADDVVAGGAVGEELVEQIAELRHPPTISPCALRRVAALPKVMMGIDDRQVWLDDGFSGARLGFSHVPRAAGKIRPGMTVLGCAPLMVAAPDRLASRLPPIRPGAMPTLPRGLNSPRERSRRRTSRRVREIA